MTDPKGDKPESDHPHEEDLPLELHLDAEGLSADDLPVSDASMSGSIEEFHFSGPVEELDFTEPANFTFPTEPAEVASDQSGEFVPEPAGVESFLGAEGFGAEPSAADPGHMVPESPLPEEAGVEPQLAGEGIADLEAAEEEAKPKPKFQLPAWVRTVEWVLVGLLGGARWRQSSSRFSG